jgi:hypothetical protein
MFGVPERRIDGNNTYFYVPMAKPIPLNLRLLMNDKIIHPDTSQQHKIATLQKTVLQELTKTDTLFKNRPTYDSLERITPQWGMIYDTDNKPQWSPYTTKELLFDVSNIGNNNFIVDLELKGIMITRSTVYPQFVVKFLESAKEIIDFDWQTNAVPVQTHEIEEVADLEADPSNNEFKLRSPALISKEKADAKEKVKVLFRLADEARAKALESYNDFHEKYELSDDESDFSDWVSDDDE